MQRQLFIDEYDNVVAFIVKAKFNIDENRYVAVAPVDDPGSKTYIYKIDIDPYGSESITMPERSELYEAFKAYEKVKNDTLQ